MFSTSIEQTQERNNICYVSSPNAKLEWLKFILVFFCFFDGLITYFCVSRGIAKEFNPLWIPIAGSFSLVFIKTAIGFLLSLAINDKHTLLSSIFIMSTVCVWNLLIIL